MKNKFLLLGATAILSTGALLANADVQLNGDQAELDIYAVLVSPMSFTQLHALSFGTIQIGANSGGKKVVVGTDDALAASGITGATTDAAMAISTNISNEIYSGDIKSGLLEVSGPLGSPLLVTGTPVFNTNPSNWDAISTLSFSDAELVPSADGSGITKCGDVSDFEYVTIPDDVNKKVTVKVGATLKLADDFSNLNNGIVECHGTTVVTWITDVQAIVAASTPNP